MTGKSVTPFELYRANLSFSLQVWSFSHEARQQACEFEMQRIRRDLAATHAIGRAASTARDWSALAVSCQTVLRDYVATTTNLWQQGLGSATRLQTGFFEGLREAFATWQAASTDQWSTHPAVNPVMLPWQEWLQRMGGAATMPGGRAVRSFPVNEHNPTDSATAPASSGPADAEDGEHHAG
ncbi:hypothetical protein BCh11DRAFT_06315 [Burkholderia sp. Ch1-1]|uniref:Phasin domain-containing protein n=1 Tax=Paraburkholderia dioscoreae TaxID=2604047 RepID=A0A5Q4YTD0_9BURK|nr:hypothetical protein [Paraburkholderia dioscoreae]EIF30809.1 hypothetical protein BCh11DRAFT_06315 [Burkholderia sp. Ch1-1]VVD28951.1 conserved protein of unknown function [Paraburkholderia dioscoreae]